ncbi:MAG: hypothetical protein JWN98_1949, partial [Abditibacteriota bacterium]|nr:hypothetical protein [Abditibacteriota bacterium]
MLSFLVAAVTVFYIAAPFRQARANSLNAPTARRRESVLRLEARREDLLRDLKDLEFDYRMQKFEASEYAELRASMAAEASEVLQKLEEVRGSQPKSGKKARRETVSATRPAADAALQDVQSVQSSAAQFDAQIEIEIMIARARRRLAPSVSATAGATNGSAQSTLWRCG